MSPLAGTFFLNRNSWVINDPASQKNQKRIRLASAMDLPRIRLGSASNPPRMSPRCRQHVGRMSALSKGKSGRGAAFRERKDFDPVSTDRDYKFTKLWPFDTFLPLHTLSP
jgi:hypothetical protein